MIKIIPKDNRHFTDFGWLKTYWLFSFANYYNPGNIRHGALRVFNDDVVEPGTGFPTHPHHEMEIITIVLDGEITHKDSMGNETVIKTGDVQRMSAGTGLTHSEYNLSDKPVHFHQIWLYPDQRKLEPTYDQRNYSPELWQNKLCPVASGQGHDNSVMFHTDAAIYRASIDEFKALEYDTNINRRLFIYATNGKFDINGEIVHAKNQARIEGEEKLHIKAAENSSFILIDAPSCTPVEKTISKGYGYDDKTLEGEKK